MIQLKYKKIDAFVSEGSLGNPAACIYVDEKPLPPDKMLAIARQHKGFVSEMVYAGSSRFADVKLTYYSSEGEVDFCGHGTIACMADLIKNTPELAGKPEVSVETNKAGLVTVYNEMATDDIFISAPEAKYIGTEVSVAAAADALELPESSISREYPIDLVSAGLRTLIVPVAGLQSEVEVFPNPQWLKDFCVAAGADIVLIWCRETADRAYTAHTRVFAPRFGYLEDPATGSGNSAFGYYMLKHGLWDGSPIAIEQGGIDRIFNTVKLKTKNGRVLFGGGVAVRISGEYYL